MDEARGLKGFNRDAIISLEAGDPGRTERCAVCFNRVRNRNATMPSDGAENRPTADAETRPSVEAEVVEWFRSNVLLEEPNQIITKVKGILATFSDDRVNRIRRSIQQGDYHVDPDALAASLVESLFAEHSDNPASEEQSLHSGEAAFVTGNYAQNQNAKAYLSIQEGLKREGIISEIKLPVTDHGRYRNRKPIVVKGKPLSEVLIEERR